MSTLPSEPDDELREWIADWQTEPEPPPALREAIRRRVRRQGSRMAWSFAGEVVLTLGLMAIVLRSATLRPEPLNLAAMAGLAVLILWAMGLSLWYQRGTWRPSAETTSAFLSLSILRCRRRLAALRAGWFLLVVELAIMIPWLYLQLSSRPVDPPDARSYAVAFGALVLVAGLVTAFLVAGKRRVLRELRELEELRQGWGGQDG